MKEKIETLQAYTLAIVLIGCTVIATVVLIHDGINHAIYAEANNCTWNEYDVCVVK